METNKVELKQIQKISEVVTYLEGLLKGFKTGKIVVRQGNNFVSLVPAEQVEVEVEVEAKKKKNKEKFSIELSWHTAACNEPVSITTKEPTGIPPAMDKEVAEIKTPAAVKDKGIGVKDNKSAPKK